MTEPLSSSAAHEAELLAEIDLLRRQLAANSGAHRMALADSRQEAAEGIQQARAEERRRAALVDLGDRMHEGRDPTAMAAIVAEIVGSVLGAKRVAYCAVSSDGRTLTIDQDWAVPGLSSLVGRYDLDDYGALAEGLRRGGAVVIADVRRDPRTAGNAAGLEKLSIRAMINHPVMEGGRTVAVLTVGDAEPRVWSAEEITFVRDVAERTRVIMERRRAEESLRDLAASLEQQVEERTRERDRVWRNSRDLLVTIGLDGTYRNVNPAWTAILGHSPAEVEGCNVRDFIWPDDLVMTEAALEGAMRQRDLTNFESRLVARDGTPRWISWHTSAEGDLLFGYGRDVTEAKLQATALSQAEEALRQSQKMEAVGQLTGGVAHDFNNLLTIIRSSVDLLRRPDLPEARRRRYIDAVSDTVDRAAKLTGQLLAFARRQALKPEIFDVGVRLRAVADMLDTVTGARIQVVTALPAQQCFVKADLSQFETALVNLAVNARDAMEGEGVLTLRLACGVAMPAIRGHAAAAGPFAAVSLTDTGSGIATDQLGRIFEPFFTTKEVGKGTGLGLSQVFGFTKQSGGDVAVESELGVGTTFTLYLPEVEPAIERVVPIERDVGPTPGGAGRRVLVVEDNVEVGRFSTQILHDLGYETSWAANAEEALDIIASGPSSFDVVFSDVVMPGMGGIELARELKRRLPDLPVVLASGYSHVLAQDGAQEFELLQKPYSAEQLSRILRRVSGRRRRAGPSSGSDAPSGHHVQ